MAFSSSRTQRPPLRHCDLDALSDAELEALLFDGVLPKKPRVPFSSALLWVGIGVGALLLVSLTEGAVLELSPFLLGAAVLFFVVKKGAFACRRPARPGRSSDARLARSSTDRRLLGVCGGLAAYFDVDACLVRGGFLVGLLATSGLPMLLAYLLLAYVLPSRPAVPSEERLRILRES